MNQNQECTYLPEYIRCDHVCAEGTEPCDRCKDYLRGFAEDAKAHNDELSQILREQ